MLGDEQESSAAPLAKPVFQVPLVLNTGRYLPFDRVERVRADVADQRGEHLAIVGEQRPTGMRGEHRPDLRTEIAPTAHAAQRVVLRGQLETEDGQRVAAGEQ